MDISKLDMGSLLNCMEVGGESWLMSKGLLVLRRMVIGDFKQLKKRTTEFSDSHEELFRSANRVLSAFGYARVNNPLSLVFVDADEDTSFSNEDWYDNMSKALDQLRDFLSAEDTAVQQLIDHLSSIESGKWRQLYAEDASREMVA